MLIDDFGGTCSGMQQNVVFVGIGNRIDLEYSRFGRQRQSQEPCSELLTLFVDGVQDPNVGVGDLAGGVRVGPVADVLQAGEICVRVNDEKRRCALSPTVRRIDMTGVTSSRFRSADSAASPQILMASAVVGHHGPYPHIAPSPMVPNSRSVA